MMNLFKKFLIRVLLLSPILNGCVQRGPLLEQSDINSLPIHGKTTKESEDKEVQKLSEKKEEVKLGLILSPGGALALAHAGVLKALEERRIKIHAVVGIEWGALTAALYADRGRSHQIDWGLFKLKGEDWGQSSILKKLLKPREQIFDDYLALALPSARRIEEFDKAFACPTLNLSSGELLLIDHGEVIATMKKCMPLTPSLQPNDWSASPWAIDESARWLRKNGATHIILINALSREALWRKDKEISPHLASQWHELRLQMNRPHDNVEVFNLNLNGFYLDSFSDKVKIIKDGYAQGFSLANELIRNRSL